VSKPRPPAASAPRSRARRWAVTSALGLALLIAGLIVAGFSSQRRLVDAIENDPRALSSSARLTNRVVDEHLSQLGEELIRLAQLHDLKEALISGNRAELLEQIRPPLNRLGKSPLQISRLTVYERSGAAYLRAHAPALHGDDATARRPLIAHVLRTRTVVKGLELENGRPYLWAATPVYDQGRWIGVLELGTPLTVVLQMVKDVTGSEVGAFLDATTPEAIDSTAPALFATLAPQLQRGDARERRSALTARGHTYAATVIPLRDFSGSLVRLVIVADASSFTGIVRRNNYVIVLISVCGFGLAALVLTVLARRLDGIYGTLEAHVHERTVRLQTLARLNQVVSSTLDADEVLARIARAAGELMEAPLVEFWIADRSAQTLALRVSSEPGLITSKRLRTLAFGHGGAGAVARDRRALHVPDVFADDRIQAPDWFAQHGFTSALWVPILFQEELLGVLSVIGRKPFERAADDELLQSFVAQAALAIHNAQQFAELRDSEDRFRDTFQQAAVGIAHVSMDGRWLRLNRRLSDILGYLPQELYDQPVHAILHAEDHDGERRQRRRIAADEIATDAQEKRFLGRDGSVIWTNVTVSLARDSAGAPKYFIMVVEDINDRKRTEQALRESEEHVRQLQKLDAIGRLAGGVAHDFNNLLTVVRGRSHLLLKSGRLPEDSRRHIEVVDKTAERAATLTAQLLAFSRKQMLQPKRLSLNTLLADMEEMLQRLLGEDIDLLVLPGRRLGQVNADPGQLQQVVLNLGVNARDAMPQGGKLTLETGNVEFDASYVRQHPGSRPGRYVMLAVTDTGLGMTADVRARIFEPFFTTKPAGKGTGLGLAMVYGIVKQSGGNVWVYSEPGKGTTFKIYLPRVAAIETVEVPEPLTPQAVGSETVMLVEDEDDLRELVREVLDDVGYTVLEAGHPEQAIGLMSQQPERPIHLLLTDVVMPGMSGPALAARLTTVRPTMKVLYMSGYTDDAIVHHGVLTSEMAYLQKPFTPRALASKVRAVLDAETSVSA